MVKKDSSKKSPSHRDLVKTVSKQLKYYFEIKRQEDGFDLSGPECPRPDYPALKSRPMLLYEGLHDRSVKHFYSDHGVKQRITHMTTSTTEPRFTSGLVTAVICSYLEMLFDEDDIPTAEAKRMQKLMRKTMDRVTYAPVPLLDFIDRVYHDKPPWMGVGVQDGSTKYTKNSDKYVTGTIGEWSMKPKQSKRRGYGNPEPTLRRAFKEPAQVKPRLRRSCPPGWIDNKECNRLVNGASRILASSEFREALSSRPQSSRGSSRRSSQKSSVRARSASPNRSGSVTLTASTSSSQRRLTYRPQSGRNTIQRGDKSQKMSYHEAKEQVVHDHEQRETSKNLKKGKIYYDIDGRRKPVPHKVKNDDEYLERHDETTRHSPEADDKVPDWLKLVGVEQTKEERARSQMRKQEVQEKKMPYNRSVRSVEISEPNTARSEDVSKREGVRVRPRSAKKTGKHSGRSRDADSHITLSEGSYEEVKLDSDSEEGEDAFYEDRGCQTGWELFVQYDQSENLLYDGEAEAVTYEIVVRTGRALGASTTAPIHVVLFGSRGRSPELPLINCENHKIPFQQNALDIFNVTCSYVGNLKKIEIGHDNEGESWFLDSVSVSDRRKREVYEFICNNWLSVKSGDKMTRRQLSIFTFRNMEKEEEEHSEEEEEEKGEGDEAINGVAQSNTPRHSTNSKSGTSSTVSSTHLRNETVEGTEAKTASGISLPSDTASTSTSVTADRKRAVRAQEPYAIQSREMRDHKGRRSPSNIEDFESDITLHSAKKSTSSRRSESTLTGSDDHTAIFEEQSVLSQTTNGEADRLEAFKAGQKAEREKQRLEQEKNRQAEITHLNDITRGPTIHQAAKSGNIIRVKELVDYNKDHLNDTDERGNTPLHLASMQGHKEIVQYLVATGAVLENRDQLGYEPCHMAALHGHVNCLMVLVAMGASIDSQTDDCKTPLHLAAMSGNMQTCRWLVANRAPLSAEDDFGRTPVDMADNNGHDEVAKFLRTCINELQGKRTSLNSLLIGGKGDNASWEDDKAEKPVTYQTGEEDSEIESVADLRKEARAKEEKEAKQKAYADMQRQLSDNNMTYLDRIRYEVDNS